ncbi:MAG: hypothetical protein HRU20_21225 [Pseudomonadales bacterium]|nr:hypothetical protein [Pseudomonadales bacterium]
MTKGLDSMAEKAAKKAAERKKNKAAPVAEVVEVTPEAEAFIDGAAYGGKKDKPVKKKQKRLNVEMDEDLYNKIKMISSMRGSTIKKDVTKWARKYVNTHTDLLPRGVSGEDE